MAVLVDLVKFQLENAKSLTQLLRDETLTITARESTQIEQVAKEKVDIINQLQQTDQRISAHPHVEELTTNTELSQLVEEILLLVTQCQEINSINGQALERAQSGFNKLNNMLQRTHGKIGMTYNAGGKTHTISTLGTDITA